MLTGKTIGQLTNISASTNNTLLVVEVDGVTSNINAQDFWKSEQPFGVMYQDLIPDAPSAHTIGSIAYPLKSIYVSTGSVFIGPNNSLAIDDSGVLYSTNVFAAPTFQVGNITSSGGVVSTSGYTFSVINNELLVQNNSGGTIYSITDQLVLTGGTINQVLTQTGNTNYEWGWSSPYVLSLGTQDGNQNPPEILDLTKQVFTFGDGLWILPDGAECQICYFVLNTGGSPADITVRVTHLRKSNASVITNANWQPFQPDLPANSVPVLVTAVFTQGAWNVSYGTIY